MDVDTEDREFKNKRCKDQRDSWGEDGLGINQIDKKQPRWLKCLHVLFIV